MRVRALLYLAFAIIIGNALSRPVAAQERALPAEAARILTRMNADIVAAKRKAAGSLDALLKETTKKGDLEGAIAIKKELESLALPAAANARLGPNVVGKWQADKSVLLFTPDGKVVNQSNGDKGQWRDTGNTIDVLWENGWKHQMRLSDNGFNGMFVGPKGETGNMTYVRIAP